MLHLGLLLVLIIAVVVGLYIMINGKDVEVGKYILIIITGLVSLIAFPLLTLVLLLLWVLYIRFCKQFTDKNNKTDG